jgi:ketosteroid isomerase-like protein
MNDVYAINLARTKYQQCFARADVDGIVSLLGDGFSDMADGRPSFWGKEAKAAFAAHLRKLFRTHRAELTTLIIAVDVQGNSASDWGWQILKLTPKKKGSKTRTIRERYFERWIKTSAGEWKLQFFISNRDLPPAMK